MSELVDAPVCQSDTESNLVLSRNHAHVVICLIRGGAESRQALSSASQVKAAGHRQNNEVRKNAVALHANRRRRKVGFMNTSDGRSIDGQAESVDCFGAH